MRSCGWKWLDGWISPTFGITLCSMYFDFCPLCGRNAARRICKWSGPMEAWSVSSSIRKPAENPWPALSQWTAAAGSSVLPLTMKTSQWRCVKQMLWRDASTLICPKMCRYYSIRFYHRMFLVMPPRFFFANTFVLFLSKYCCLEFPICLAGLIIYFCDVIIWFLFLINWQILKQNWMGKKSHC